ncbi:hypothetical protein BXY70_0109 [Roseovarius halotolerans]|uniref:Uncharacterized protein n=1 Tax=Roseovarius halotolerans TaxID=505353 RepID=A0A1X6YP18_9RHOB|nr:hypothetical protein [Roseovarius halotolerans]RKT34104.1 hypothetical protein BXY70_0109 [Roseovarius halotolerans]SLN27077.1 hypothetical protein ROH8110_01286 [Roseovarius halotolerans]
MGVTEDMADQLAQDVIKYIEATGDEDVVSDMIKLLGASSQTAEEAFLTSLRVRRANMKARAMLMERARKFQQDNSPGTADKG